MSLEPTSKDWAAYKRSKEPVGDKGHWESHRPAWWKIQDIKIAARYKIGDRDPIQDLDWVQSDIVKMEMEQEDTAAKLWRTRMYLCLSIVVPILWKLTT